MKRAKDEWQLKVRQELERRGLSYKDLANAKSIPYTEGTIRQAMCHGGYENVRNAISKFLGV